MKCPRYPENAYLTPGNNHSKCGFAENRDEMIECDLSEMSSGMQEAHRKHMATQRLKLAQSDTLMQQLQ